MENWILEYLDGRLSHGRRREAEAHLEACDACRIRVNEFRAVSGLLGELPAIEPSAAFDLRMHARVAAEPVRRGWLDWLALSPRVAFAASLLLLLVVWSGNRPADVDNYPFHPPAAVMGADDHIRMVKDLAVLEDYDVLANFEPLADLPHAAETDQN
jgi:anti-sigma factor RsiW